jgi:2-polyprenyl-3-methyl-5-hydroxy-6-metoxy-1,4-benzoquinol methylase
LRGHKSRVAFDVDYAIRYLPQKCCVLEIGAYPYFLTLPLLNLGFTVSPLDNTLVAEGATEGMLNASPLRCDIDRDRIPADNNIFDAVIINEVIEHLRVNLIHSVSELHRVLRPGGVLLMSTPNFRSLAGLYNLVVKGEAWACAGGVYQQFSYLKTYDVMGHIREYTPTEMQKFFERIGFHVNGIIYRGGYSRRHLSYYFTILRPEFKPFFSLVCSKSQ